MEIKKEINGFYELADMVWSGAVDTIADIQNADKENEFMDFLVKNLKLKSKFHIDKRFELWYNEFKLRGE